MKLSKITGEPLTPIQAVAGEYGGIEFEGNVLNSIDRVLAPAFVLAVLNGEDPTDEYNDWLVDQYYKMQAENEERLSESLGD